MATKLSSIIVTNLSTTSRYVDTFYVEVFAANDVNSTKVAIGQCGTYFDGTVARQQHPIEIDGLNFGQTYYLRAGSGIAASSWITFTGLVPVVAGAATAPAGVTYTGTYNSTTSLISALVTPHSVPSDIDHYEACWTYDGSTPASTAQKAYDVSNAPGSGTQLILYCNGKPGENITIFIRAVNTSQQRQAWTSLGTFPIATEWQGSVNGTIEDTSHLGTGGPTINSHNTGRLGLGLNEGSQFFAIPGNYQSFGLGNSVTEYNDNSYSYQVGSSTGKQVVYDAVAGQFRSYMDTLGQFGYNMLPQSGFVSAQAGNSYTQGVANAFNQYTATSGASFQNGSSSTNYVVYDVNAGAFRSTLNPTGQFGFGLSPSSSFVLSLNGNQAINGSGNAFNQFTDSLHSYQIGSSVGNAVFFDVTNGAFRMTLNTGGAFGFGFSPVSGFTTSINGNNYVQGAGNSITQYLATTGGNYQFGVSANDLVVFDNTTGLFRTTIGTSGGFGIGSSPVGANWLTVGGQAVINGSARLASSGISPLVNTANQFVAGNASANTGTSTTITMSACVAKYGAGSLSYNSGSVNPGAYGQYYLYGDDANYSGGAIPYQVTTDISLTVSSDGRIFFSAILTIAGQDHAGGFCLVQGTPITMADGSTKPVEQLVVGDDLKTLYGSAKLETVDEIQEQDIYRVELENGMVIEGSDSHPVLNWGLWATLLDLYVNYTGENPKEMRLSVDTDDEVSVVTSITKLETKASVWKLHLEEDHIYVGGGVWAHNKPPVFAPNLD